MTRILFTTDFHLGCHKRHKRHQEDIRKSIQYVVNKAVEYKVDYFICGGDTLDTATRITNSDLLFLSNILHTLKDKTTLSWLIGNHDTHSEPIMRAFKGCVPYLVDRTNYLSMGAIRVSPMVEILMVPHLYNNDPLPSLHPLCENVKRILITHQAVELSKDIKSEIPIILDRGIETQRIFTKKDIQQMYGCMVFCGHVHYHMEYLLDEIPIYYPGATSILNFGEVNSGNGFYIIDIEESREIKVNYHPIGQRKWIVTQTIPERIEPDTIYRIEVPENKVESSRFLKLYFNELNSEVFFKINPIENTFENRIEGIGDMSDTDQLISWLKYKGITNVELYLNEHKKIIEQI